MIEQKVPRAPGRPSASDTDRRTRQRNGNCRVSPLKAGASPTTKELALCARRSSAWPLQRRLSRWVEREGQRYAVQLSRAPCRRAALARAGAFNANFPIDACPANAERLGNLTPARNP